MVDSARGFQPLAVFRDGSDRARVSEELAEATRDDVEEHVVVVRGLGELASGLDEAL